MKTPVIKFDLQNELDIILAHKRASQLCELTGIGVSVKTGFVTAISEICRNCLEYAKKGEIVFNIIHDEPVHVLEVIITDAGPGIARLGELLNNPVAPGSKGCGLQYSKKLVDFFHIETSPNGTSVTMGMKILTKTIPINKLIISGWARYFEKEVPVSPYEEIKKQNMQLLEVTEQLRLKNLEASEQIEEINALNSQLNKANIELEDYAYTISHDLKSPINNLNLLLTLVENAKDTDQKATYFQQFGKIVNRLNELFTGLTQMIDLQNQEVTGAKEIYFDDILQMVKDEYKIDMEATSTNVTHLFDVAPSIIYYEVYLFSIFSNLISNAIKYRKKDKSPQITISTLQSSDYIVLKIQDDGIGMDMSKVGKKLFKPFKRFNKQVEGRGIGLHLIKNMVEKNGGRIEVESKPGQGSTFTVYLKEYSKTRLRTKAVEDPAVIRV